MRTNIVIPSEATHSSSDLFEKPLLLVTFDQSFEQKTGPLYSPSVSSLEFEVVSDRNIFIDLQKITWRSSVEYFKHIERICATQTVMLMKTKSFPVFLVLKEQKIFRIMVLLILVTSQKMQTTL